MKILVVEDDSLQSERILVLTSEFFQKDCTLIGPYEEFGQAAAAARDEAPDLALIDIALHEDRYAGINIALMLQEFHPVPVVFLTGLTDQTILQKASKVNTSDFLRKPFDKDGLHRALTKALDQHKQNIRSVHRMLISPKGKDHFWAKTDRDIYQKIPLADILFFKSGNHYVEVYVKDRKLPLLIHGRLRVDVFEAHLQYVSHFYLLGRRYIINLDHILSIKGNDLIIKGNKPEIPYEIRIPRERKKSFFNWLEINTEK